MPFYDEMRSEAERLIREFGQPAEFRSHEEDTYDVVAGSAIKADSWVKVHAAVLPRSALGSPQPEFTQEEISKFDQIAIVSVPSPDKPRPVPQDDFRLDWDGAPVARVVAVANISPAGYDVMYKVGIAYA